MDKVFRLYWPWQHEVLDYSHRRDFEIRTNCNVLISSIYPTVGLPYRRNKLKEFKERENLSVAWFSS